MNLQIVVKIDNNYLSHIMMINTLTDRDKDFASGISWTPAIISRGVVKSRSHRNFPEIIYLRDFKIQYPRARLDREHEVRIFCHMAHGRRKSSWPQVVPVELETARR